MGGLDDDRRDRWMSRLITFGLVIAVFAGAAIYVKVTSKHRRFGEACEHNGDCGEARGLCLVAEEGSICTRHCEKEADCPAGWACEINWELDENGAKAGTMMKACVKR